MPEISRFFGIIIRMYIEAGGPRHTPHQEELRADWRGLQNGRPPVKIEPLK